MTNVKPTPPSGLYDFLFNRLGKEGVFAILFIATLGIILYGGWNLALFSRDQAAGYVEHQKTVMASLANANAKNADSTAQISEAVSALLLANTEEHLQHSEMLKSVTTISDYIAIDSAREESFGEKLELLVEQMQLANQMMAAVPQQREEQSQAMLSLLQQIKSGIEQLSVDLKGCAVQPSESGQGTE